MKKPADRSPSVKNPSRRTRVAPERRYAIIMAGGVGTRFWPWSREGMPKQMLPLACERSMLAETVARLEGLVPPANILVVTSRRLAREVARQLPGLSKDSILAEPIGRNTAACIGWATLEVLARRPDAVTAVLPADHVIRPEKAFRSDVGRAFEVADQTGGLVTFGIAPSSPATGYGYIRVGAALAGASPALEVAGFVEKPNLAVARRYVSSGRYFWNSGMFVWRADTIWQELTTHLPTLAAGLSAMCASRRGGVVPARVVDRAYPGLESISIDYGVLERSRRVSMLPTSFEWSDIGSWDAVAGLWPLDEVGNASRDRVVAVDATGNVVASRGKPVALLGVRDLVIIDTGDALLVCPRDRCQDVRSMVAALREAGLEKLL